MVKGGMEEIQPAEIYAANLIGSYLKSSSVSIQ
jgi:hypothetical protein